MECATDIFGIFVESYSLFQFRVGEEPISDRRHSMSRTKVEQDSQVDSRREQVASPNLSSPIMFPLNGTNRGMLAWTNVSDTLTEPDGD